MTTTTKDFRAGARFFLAEWEGPDGDKNLGSASHDFIWGLASERATCDEADWLHGFYVAVSAYWARPVWQRAAIVRGYELARQ